MSFRQAAATALLVLLAASPAATALVIILAGSTAAAGINGVWLAQARSAHIQIFQCGAAVCGRMISATRPKTNPELLDIHNEDPALRRRSMVGAVLIQGFKGGPTTWKGGRVYNPGDGKSYKGALTLVDRDHLKLEGCALAIFCKSQILKRVG